MRNISYLIESDPIYLDDLILYSGSIGFLVSQTSSGACLAGQMVLGFTGCQVIPPHMVAIISVGR